MKIVKPALCLNIDDPEQKELFEYITKLPNGKKRNTSAFLKTLVDRDYQKKKDEYLAEREKHKKPIQKVPVKGGGIQIKLN